MPAGESVALDGGRIMASRPAATTTHHRIHIGATGTHIAGTAPQIQFGKQWSARRGGGHCPPVPQTPTAPTRNSAPPPPAAAGKKTKKQKKDGLSTSQPGPIQISNDATADAARKRGERGVHATAREEDGGGG